MSASCAATRSRCSRSAATTWATTWPTGWPIGEREGAKLPKLFNVNWFRKDPDSGDYLWPGFGENARVLAWVFRRCEDDAEARETPVGLLPTPDSLDLSGLDIDAATIEAVLDVDLDEWRAEIPLIREFFEEFGDRLPAELRDALDGLEGRLRGAS